MTNSCQLSVQRSAKFIFLGCVTLLLFQVSHATWEKDLSRSLYFSEEGRGWITNYDLRVNVIGHSTPYICWRTGEGILLEVQMHDGRHEAQLDRKHGDPIAAEVQKGQLQVRDLCKGDKNKRTAR